MKRFAITIGIALLLVAGWSAAWFLGAGWLRDQVVSASADSPSLTCGDIKIAGYPFRFDLTCSAAALAYQDITIKLPEIRATALIYRLTHVLIFLESPAQITDAFSGAANSLSWTMLEGSVRLNNWAMARASLIGDNLVFNDVLLTTTELGRAAHLDMQILGTDGAKGVGLQNIELFVRIKDGLLPQAAMSQVAINGLATEIPADVRLWGLPDMVRNWALAGGTLKLNSADFDNANVSAKLSGELAVGGDGLANGQFTMISKGLRPFVREMFPSPMDGLILGREQADGTSKQTMTIIKSVVRAGALPLYQLPPLF